MLNFLILKGNIPVNSEVPPETFVTERMKILEFFFSKYLAAGRIKNGERKALDSIAEDSSLTHAAISSLVIS